MSNKQFKAPYFTRHQIWEEADKLRSMYWNNHGLPVPVLDIAEIDMDLEVRPVSRLREIVDTEAILLNNWSTILVDSSRYMDERFHNRLRFSVAHELGHFILHQNILPRVTEENWIEFVQAIPEEQYSYLEYHANEFAGRLLVPYEALKESLMEKVERAKLNGLPPSSLSDQHRSYFSGAIAKEFSVSGEVIDRRLEKEGLWPIEQL